MRKDFKTISQYNEHVQFQENQKKRTYLISLLFKFPFYLKLGVSISYDYMF